MNAPVIYLISLPWRLLSSFDNFYPKIIVNNRPLHSTHLTSYFSCFVKGTTEFLFTNSHAVHKIGLSGLFRYGAACKWKASVFNKYVFVPEGPNRKTNSIVWYRCTVSHIVGGYVLLVCTNQRDHVTSAIISFYLPVIIRCVNRIIPRMECIGHCCCRVIGDENTKMIHNTIENVAAACGSVAKMETNAMSWQ